jgi:hypothetical protein
MGFLGVMQDPHGAAFCVPELNVNLWLLPGLLGRCVVYLDIGIHLQAPPESKLNSLVLLLPGGTDSKPNDLADRLLDPKVARLIFGEQVDVDIKTSMLCFTEGTNVEVIPITTTETIMDKQRSDNNFSYWQIHLARPVRGTAYVRLRFRIRTRGRMLLIRGFGMFANRILVDMRVSDLRESVTVPDEAIYQRSLIAIEKLTCHIVVPTRFRAPVVGESTLLLSPRILEGTVWERYLGRATYLLNQGKLTVYPWHRDEQVTLNRPFRAFIDVHRDIPALLSRQFFLTLLAAICAAVAVIDPRLLRNSFVAHAANAGGHAVWRLLAAAGIVSLTGYLTRLPSWRQRLRSMFYQLEQAITAIENLLYWARMARPR